MALTTHPTDYLYLGSVTQKQGEIRTQLHREKMGKAKLLPDCISLSCVLGYIQEWDCFHKENNSVSEVINAVQFITVPTLMPTGPC